MKGSKVFIFIGAILVITLFICNYKKSDLYEKKVHYASPDQIVDVFNNNKLSIEDKGNVYSTKEYLECVSKRRRICNDVFEVDSIHLTYDKEYNTTERIDSLYKEYIKKKKKYSEPYTDIDIRFYSGVLNSDEKVKIGIVFIDEGEGYVMDYYEIVEHEGEEEYPVDNY